MIPPETQRTNERERIQCAAFFLVIVAECLVIAVIGYGCGRWM